MAKKCSSNLSLSSLPTKKTNNNKKPQLTNTILDIVQQAANYKQLRKGANEGEATTKERSIARRRRRLAAAVQMPSSSNPPRRRFHSSYPDPIETTHAMHSHDHSPSIYALKQRNEKKTTTTNNSHQDAQPRHFGIRRHGCRHRADRDPAPPPAARRGQERAVRVRPFQGGARARVRRDEAGKSEEEEGKKHRRQKRKKKTRLDRSFLLSFSLSLIFFSSSLIKKTQRNNNNHRSSRAP